jgi:8-oxo-dGTP pyrophosphatase MutT (NUDIX family)
MRNNKETIMRIVNGEKADVQVGKRTIAKTVFYDGVGNVLLQNRKSISKAGEKWGLFGGGIEGKEDPEQGLARELGEEIANLPGNLSFVKLAEMRVAYFNKLRKQYRDLYEHVFACKLLPKIDLEVLEGDGAKWFSYDEAKRQIMIPGNAEAIQLAKDLANGKQTHPKMFTQNGYRDGYYLEIIECD